MFGFMRIIQYFLLQKSTIDTPPNHIVVRTAAPHMHNNYFRLFNQSAKKDMFIYIDCFDKNQFTKIKRLKFWDIFSEFYLTLLEGIPIISKLSKDEGRFQIACQAMRLMPVFSYFTCLLKNLKNKNSNIKIFSGGADLISASAIVSNVETYWLAHGLIDPANLVGSRNIKPDPSKYFIAYPDFDYVYLYSQDEAEYLKDHGVSSELRLYPYKKLDNLNIDAAIDGVLIKLDVEGHEVQVLNGSKNFINKYKPVICFEQHEEDFINSSSATIKFLSELNYNFYLYSNVFDSYKFMPLRVLLKFIFQNTYKLQKISIFNKPGFYDSIIAIHKDYKI